MERAEPALKPEWLKSSSNGTSNHHHVGTSPLSDEQGVGISSSSRNRLLSSSSSSSSSSLDRDRKTLNPTKRSLSTNGSRTHEPASNKSKAYSSFGSCRREREKRPTVLLNGFDDRLTDNPLRRSRSLITSNGMPSRSTGGSFEKEFPSLGKNGSNGRAERFETGRVSSPLQSIPMSGVVESWNSVLVDVPPPNIIVNGNGSNGSGSALAGPLSPATGSGLNMAETVAQTPSRVRTPPQLVVDTQKIEERTLKQFKQLIPVTPSMPKSSVSSSLDKMKNKTPRALDSVSISAPKSMQPPSPAIHPKPTQIGNFQVLNRDKPVISPASNPPPVSTKPVMSIPVPSAVPLRSPTNRVHSQSKGKLEFFRFIRNQSLGATSASLPDQDKENENVPKEEKSVEKEVVEGVERKLVIGNGNGNGVDAGLNGDVDLDPDPEEEAFLLSLGWDQNAEVDALTNEEIEAFVMKYKEVKQRSTIAA